MSVSATLRTRSFLAEHVDQGEHAAEQQSEGTEGQCDQPIAERRADVGAHDHADGRSQPRIPELTSPTTMTVIAVLDWRNAGNERAGDHALDRRPCDRRQQVSEPVDGETLDPVGHELEPEHEDAEPADDGNEEILEVVDFHATPVVPGSSRRPAEIATVSDTPMRGRSPQGRTW